MQFHVNYTFDGSRMYLITWRPGKSDYVLHNEVDDMFIHFPKSVVYPVSISVGKKRAGFPLKTGTGMFVPCWSNW